MSLIFTLSTRCLLKAQPHKPPTERLDQNYSCVTKMLMEKPPSNSIRGEWMVTMTQNVTGPHYVLQIGGGLKKKIMHIY